MLHLTRSVRERLRERNLNYCERWLLQRRLHSGLRWWPGRSVIRLRRDRRATFRQHILLKPRVRMSILAMEHV